MASEKEILAESRQYISKLLGESSIDVRDSEMFETIAEDCAIGGQPHSVHMAKFLTGHPISGESSILKYTFTILRVPSSLKEQYAADENFIGEFYARYLPAAPDMMRLQMAVAALLVEDVFPGRGYRFLPYLVTVTNDLDMACVFYEGGSLESLASGGLLSRLRKAVGW